MTYFNKETNKPKKKKSREEIKFDFGFLYNPVPAVVLYSCFF